MLPHVFQKEFGLNPHILLNGVQWCAKCCTQLTMDKQMAEHRLNWILFQGNKMVIISFWSSSIIIFIFWWASNGKILYTRDGWNASYSFLFSLLMWWVIKMILCMHYFFSLYHFICFVSFRFVLLVLVFCCRCCCFWKKKFYLLIYVNVWLWKRLW